MLVLQLERPECTLQNCHRLPWTGLSHWWDDPWAWGIWDAYRTGRGFSQPARQEAKRRDRESIIITEILPGQQSSWAHCRDGAGEKIEGVCCAMSRTARAALCRLKRVPCRRW
jgi:hypothetical protein